MRRGGAGCGGAARRAPSKFRLRNSTTRTGTAAASRTSGSWKPASWRSLEQCETQAAPGDATPAPQSQSAIAGIAIACAIEPRSMSHAASARLACANARSAISVLATRRIRRILMAAPLYTAYRNIPPACASNPVMMHMDSMMPWMMGIGLLGWVLVIALLVTILIVLIRLVSRQDRPDGGNARSDRGPERGGPP